MGPGVNSSKPGHAGGDMLDWKISTRDLIEAGDFLSQDLIASPRVDFTSRPRIAISRIKAVDVTFRLSIDILVDKFIDRLNQSGKCIPTKAFNLAQLDNDPLIAELRKTRGSEEIDPSTQIDKGKLKQPRYSITGSIHEETKTRPGGFFRRPQSEKVYTIKLSLNDLVTGDNLWSKQYFVSKQGTGSARTW